MLRHIQWSAFRDADRRGRSYPGDQPKSGNPGALEYALLVLLAVLWGGSYAFIKIAVETVPPLTTIAIRAVLAGFILAVVARVQGHRLDAVRGQWPALLMQAMLNSILVGVAFLGESIGWSTVAGVILILTGVATINRAKRASAWN